MRAQPTKIQTGKKRKFLLLSAAGILLTACVLLLLYPPAVGYSPPEFDRTALPGKPSPDAGFAYGEISAENGFSFSIAGNIYQQQDGSVMLYLTNPENSGYELMAEMVDDGGEVLYKSGAISPGCYVERLTPRKTIANVAMQVELRVYAFEHETWYSRGTIILHNTLQPW